MSQLLSRVQILGAVAIGAGMLWGVGLLAAALPQPERLHAAAHSVRLVDYATDVVAPGSRFAASRPTYDQ
jgi:hypothetical protein